MILEWLITLVNVMQYTCIITLYFDLQCINLYFDLQCIKLYFDVLLRAVSN